jgi:hypothetical protein
MSTKVFCIGLNKTGTTSMEKYFSLLGYNVCDQVECEILTHNILTQSHKIGINVVTELECTDLFNLVEQCNFFQDIPFSLPYFYRILLEKYPDSKFIFTIRKNGEEWANSLIKFHTVTFDKEIITNHKGYNINKIYHYNSIIRHLFISMGFTDNENWYDKQRLMNFYENYINDVSRDFKDNENFLLLDINNPAKKQLIDQFLNLETNNITFPHLIKSN